MTNVAINGLGRIGRATLKIVLDTPGLGLVAANECTGAFTRREDLEAHLRAGAKYVILSAPSKGDGVETIVHGVNTPQGTPRSSPARAARPTASHQ